MFCNIGFINEDVEIEKDLGKFLYVNNILIGLFLLYYKILGF